MWLVFFSSQISQALNFFVRMGADLEANITALERMNEMCEVPAEDAWENESSRPADSWPDRGGITFDDYSVKYREELDYVLKNITTEILPGEKIGIIGRTGAGKSSLFLGLFRMLENKIGEIKIDDVNISKIGLHDLRHKLTIIPQVRGFWMLWTC
jgi:ATP-binding cassette subfamily C (CFTR/MRP) protein 1